MKLAGDMELFEILLDLLAAAVDHNHVMMLVLNLRKLGDIVWRSSYPSIGFPQLYNHPHSPRIALFGFC
jgi:hypothetical protein